MALQQYPSFTFNEQLVGPRPVRTFVQDVAGVVGQFVRGFQNVAFPVDVAESFQRFGRRGTLNGDVGVQAIAAQGASALLVSAVHGSAKAPFKVMTLKGAASAGGTVKVTLTDKRVTPDPLVVNYSFTVANTNTAKFALDELAKAINADPTSLVTAVVDPTSVDADARMTLTLKVAGTLATNLVTVEFETATMAAGYNGAYPATADDAVADKSLTGGLNGPVPAEAKLKAADDTDVLLLRMLYVGSDANGNVVARVKEGSLPSKRTVIVEHKVDGLIDEIKDVDLKDVEDVNLLVGSKGKILIEARVLNDTKTLKVTTEDVPFADGTDGAPVTTADYLRAIDALEVEPCTFILAPALNGAYPAGVERGAVEDALKAQAERIEAELGEAYGLRVAVLWAKRALVAAECEAEATIDSERVVKVAGWVTPRFAPKLGRYSASPDAFYVGKAMRTPIQASVAARETSPAFAGIAEVDTPVGPKAWNTLTAYRMDAIVKDPVLKVFQCLNGRTTTSSPSKAYWLCYRRVMDRTRTKVFQVIYTTMSEPSNRELDSDIEARINNILDLDMKSRVFAGYDPAISNDSNNPPAVRAAGQRFIDFGVELIPPNDFTTVNVSRVLRASVRI